MAAPPHPRMPTRPARWRRCACSPSTPNSRSGALVALGLSLGKTHYVLHALLDKGLVKIRELPAQRQQARLRLPAHAQGVKEKAATDARLSVRKEAEFERLQSTIAQSARMR